ncbi:MAG: hypothetical protein CMI01_03260 [Oceanospirillaceae bacterium]|nr:hypothetical protein [Oceanospirillaceae bacterium]
MNIHLCIVTGQPLANLIPILQEKPARVALAISADMAAPAQRFVRTLESAGWSPDQIDQYPGVPSSDHDRIFESAVEIEDALLASYPQARITFNATGGNKLMALAFMSVFNSERHRVIYTDTRARAIEVLAPATDPALPMQSVLSLPVYLKAEGKTLRSRQDSDQQWQQQAISRRKATQFLGRRAEALEGLVGIFNTHFAPFNKGALPEPLNLSRPPRGDWKEALNLLREVGVLDGDEQRWYPGCADCALYLSGAWLEEYVWLAARDAGADDVAISLVFTDDFDRRENIRNEIDLALLHFNRLLLIECKTGNVTREGKDADIIYKLDSLKEQAGGLMAEAALVSFRPLSYQNRDGRNINSRARAQSLRIHTCDAGGLATLSQRLRHWVEHGIWPDQ